jgi:hypothetical protein
VVGGSACGQEFDAEIRRNTPQVSPQRFLHLGRNGIAAVFRAENAVNEMGGVGLRYSYIVLCVSRHCSVHCYKNVVEITCVPSPEGDSVALRRLPRTDVLG